MKEKGVHDKELNLVYPLIIKNAGTPLCMGSSVGIKKREA
jgi:hypothetical protein